MENLIIDKTWFDDQKNNDEIEIQLLKNSFINISKINSKTEDIDSAFSLVDFLNDNNRIDEGIYVLQWISLNPAFKDQAQIINKLKKLFESDKNSLKLIKPAGFEEENSLNLCFDKLHYLRRLKEEILCYHETWGFGVINEVDYFYNELVVDFDNKKDHILAFNYAAEALQIIPEDHILSIKYNNPDSLNNMIKKEPGEVIRLSLKSYGNMTVARLIDRLVPDVISEKEWKRFWDAARKKLKSDASIEIPKKRTDFIELYEGLSNSYDDVWFEKLNKENDIERLFDRFKEIIERKINIESDIAKNVLSNRLAYIIKGSPKLKPEWKAEGFIFGRLFNINPDGLDIDKILHKLIEDDLSGMLDRLPSRQLETLLSILIENDKEAVITRLKRIIPTVGYSVLNEIMSSLIRHNEIDEVKQIISSSLARRKASSSMLLWCQKTDAVLNEWSLISKSDLAFRIQEVLEQNLSGILLKSQNQLRERFQNQDWLYDVMSDMTEQQRRDFMRRIHEGHGWESLDRKSLMAKVLRKYPNLQDIVVPTGSVQVKKEIPFTSSRMFRERQRQLEKIMKVDIPENSKEIELARSYGDLKENAEFKYAKERQALLMAQGAKLAEELEIIKPTDFKESKTDEVRIGSGVKLRMTDGSEFIYFILGIWDQDDDLNIISSETRLAKALLGLKVDEKVTLPDGEASIMDILPLTSEVRSWITK
ncbi:MAG: GreA/GreB family elongation factor [Pontiellaceae bacterium]